MNELRDLLQAIQIVDLAGQTISCPDTESEGLQKLVHMWNYLKAQLPAEVVIPGRDIEKYLQLRQVGYKTLWSGEGRIAMGETKVDTNQLSVRYFEYERDQGSCRRQSRRSGPVRTKS